MDPNIHIELIDGADIFFPDEYGWQRLRETSRLSNLTMTSPVIQQLTWWSLDFVKKHPSFRVGLYLPGPRSTSLTLPRNRHPIWAEPFNDLRIARS